MFRRISVITCCSLIPKLAEITSNGVLSSHAISMMRDSSLSVKSGSRLLMVRAVSSASVFRHTQYTARWCHRQAQLRRLGKSIFLSFIPMLPNNRQIALEGLPEVMIAIS